MGQVESNKASEIIGEMNEYTMQNQYKTSCIFPLINTEKPYNYKNCKVSSAP